ncbi:hypothetical protein AB4Y45_35600 [Paraburkholderia sp. EG287A]|uniref:hypothetical protein n=1 Tax=Paraburkholderia sp. EG287A TaxID=3237012 RepID=UPI0034D34BF7
MATPREPEQFPVINGLDEPRPDGAAGQFAVIPDDEPPLPPSDDWDAGQFRMFGD